MNGDGKVKNSLVTLKCTLMLSNKLKVMSNQSITCSKNWKKKSMSSKPLNLMIFQLPAKNSWKVPSKLSLKENPIKLLQLLLSVEKILTISQLLYYQSSKKSQKKLHQSNFLNSSIIGNVTQTTELNTDHKNIKWLLNSPVMMIKNGKKLKKPH